MPNTTMRVATFNANSIRTRLTQVLAWLEEQSPDILGIQETKAQDPDFPAVPLRDSGWHVVFRGQKAHAGVAIISREACEDVAFGFDDGGEPDEVRLIRASLRGISVINTYVPQGRSPDSPHFRYKLEWLARLRNLFERQYSPDDPVVWIGDFNVAPEPIDVHDPKALKNHVDYHPEARAALEQVREWGFVDVLRKLHPGEAGQYSYWDYRVRNAVDRGVGWRVDHIWTTRALAERCTSAWIDAQARRAEQPSDHTFVVADFAL